MTERVKLPGRRLATAQLFTWKDRDWLLKVGWDTAGIVREIFVDGVKVDSDTQAFLSAAAMLASRLLQCGDRADELARWVGGPINPVGALLTQAAEIEAQDGETIRLAYSQAARHYDFARWAPAPETTA